MPKVYFLATVVTLVAAGLVLTGCPNQPVVPEIMPQFDATPVRGEIPLTVYFNDTTDPGDISVRAWHWDFGDGAKGTGPSPSHEYKVAGVFPVRLTLTTGKGEFFIVQDDLIKVSSAGNFTPPDSDTGVVSAEGVIITVPLALADKVTFGITKDTKPMAPDAPEKIVLMSETYTFSNDLDTPELYVYDDRDRPVPTTISMPLLDKLPVPVIDPAALFLLAKMQDGRTIPIPGKVEQNRFVASVLRLPAKARYAVALRPETVSDDSRQIEGLYQDRLNADDDWAEYWKMIVSKTTAEELAAAYYGDIENEPSFYRRDFTTTEVSDAVAMALGVAQIVSNLLAEADMRVPTLVMETDHEGGVFHNLVVYDMHPNYSYDIENVTDVAYYDYFFGHLVIDPAQLIAISIRNLRIASADPEAVDIKQKLSAVSSITESIIKSTYAGYDIPAITTTGGGPLDLPEPADRTSDGLLRPVDFMEALLNGGPIYLAQRIEGILINDSVAVDDLNIDVVAGELRKLARGFGANEYAMLSDPLFFSYSPDVPNYNVSGQEFFCYLHNDADFEEPMGLLVGTIEAIAQEINEYIEDALYPVDFVQALVGMYVVMDEGVSEIIDEQETVTAPESRNLRDFYWKYLKDRAYINSGEALLRPTDVLRPPFTLNTDRFAEEATVYVPVDAPTDSFTLLPGDYAALEDMYPLSGRVVIFDLNSLSNELVLTFNTAGWTLDDDGYGPAVAVYKEGSDGVELGDPAGLYRDYEVLDTTEDGVNDTIIVRRLQPNVKADEEEEICGNRVVVVIGNLNYESLSDVSIAVNSYSDLVVPETDIIHQYVYACDPLYEYSLKTTYNLSEEGVAAYVLNMTSGSWRSANDVYETVWEHELVIIEPDNVRESTAMLVISGGDIESGVDPMEIVLLSKFATETQSLVVLLAGVPNQPLHFVGERHSRSEDAIIAYSYDKYMNSYEEGVPEPTWPVLLPMTRAAVRALDTVQDFMANKPGRVQEVDNFVVVGASKRGWATWLTAVAETIHAEATGAESRVSAIIPMVIDILNMPAQLSHHYKAYQGYPFTDPLNGIFRGYSNALRDYVALEIFDRFDTDGGQSLLEIVDPYTYRNILTLPKLIANSTGDQFFLPDSSKFYFDDMVGQNFLHYAANADHSLTNSLMVDTDTLETMLAFYRAQVKNMSSDTTTPVVLPTYNWEPLENREEVVGGMIVTYARTKVTATPSPFVVDATTKDVIPDTITVWSAYTRQQRDFRLESSQPPLWVPQVLEYDPAEGGWIMEAEIPNQGWRGFYGKLRFQGSAPGADFLFTTPVRVVPDNKYPAPNLDRD